MDRAPTSVPDYTPDQCSIVDAQVTGDGPYKLTYTCSCGTAATVGIRLLESGAMPDLDFAGDKFSDNHHNINCWNLGVLWARKGPAGLAAFLSAMKGGGEWQTAFAAACDGPPSSHHGSDVA